MVRKTSSRQVSWIVDAAEIVVEMMTILTIKVLLVAAVLPMSDGVVAHVSYTAVILEDCFVVGVFARKVQECRRLSIPEPLVLPACSVNVE
jgi:actin-like ATPase involved in cell morphogenesis